MAASTKRRMPQKTGQMRVRFGEAPKIYMRHEGSAARSNSYDSVVHDLQQHAVQINEITRYMHR